MLPKALLMACGAGECNILGQFALLSMVLTVHLFTNMKKATCKFSCSFLLVDYILHIDLSPIQFPFHPFTLILFPLQFYIVFFIFSSHQFARPSSTFLHTTISSQWISPGWIPPLVLSNPNPIPKSNRKSFLEYLKDMSWNEQKILSFSS